MRMSQETSSESVTETGAVPRSARPYRAPTLIEYGPVVKLTQGTRSVMNDGPMGGHRRMAMCL